MDDLLDMDWGQGQAQGQGLTSTASMMPAMGGQAAPTHTNTSHTSMTNPEKEKEKKSSKSKGKDKEKGSDKPAEKAKSSSGSKKSSGGHVWLPLANGKQVDVFYSASIAGNDPTHSSYPLISTRPPSQSFLLIHNLNPLHQSTSSNPSSHIPSHPPTQPTSTHTPNTTHSLHLPREPDIYEKIARSIAPQIQGEYTRDLKRAIACLLFGGSRKLLPDGVKLRGDINVLLMGDPSTAKSQFLKFVGKVAPVSGEMCGCGCVSRRRGCMLSGRSYLALRFTFLLRH